MKARSPISWLFFVRIYEPISAYILAISAIYYLDISGTFRPNLTILQLYSTILAIVTSLPSDSLFFYFDETRPQLAHLI